jgi:hypothetical protein
MDEKSAQKIYASYGRFCIAFENAIMVVRAMIVDCFNEKESYKVHLLLAESNAMPLLKQWRALLQLKHEGHKAIQERVNILYNSLVSLVETRNDIVHGHWGFESKNLDYKAMIGTKGKIQKDGLMNIEMKYSCVEFDELSAKLHKAPVALIGINLLHPDKELAAKGEFYVSNTELRSMKAKR